jgi:hypothetical protein
VECKWEGKPVQKSLTYLPSDSLNAVELTGTFGEQAQRFIGRYTEDIARATEDIADSKRSVSERVRTPMSGFIVPASRGWRRGSAS